MFEKTLAGVSGFLEHVTIANALKALKVYIPTRMDATVENRIWEELKAIREELGSKAKV